MSSNPRIETFTVGDRGPISVKELEALEKKYGILRHPTMTIPCSGCNIGCRPVPPSYCYCIRCHDDMQTQKEMFE